MNLELNQTIKMRGINFSNHPSKSWSIEQKNAFRDFVVRHREISNVDKVDFEIVDVQFPDIPPDASKSVLEEIANNYVDKIKAYSPQVVMVQGEYGLTYIVVNMLKQKEICVVYATTKREVVEKENGEKISVFKFVQFREY